MVGQNAVLVDYRHDVSRDRHCHEVEQRDEMRERNTVVLGKSLHELEAHSTAAQVLEGVGVVLPLGVKDSYCRRHHVVGYVMVTDNKVDAQLFCIGNFLDGLDTTIEDNN